MSWPQNIKYAFFAITWHGKGLVGLLYSSQENTCCSWQLSEDTFLHLARWCLHRCNTQPNVLNKIIERLYESRQTMARRKHEVLDLSMMVSSLWSIPSIHADHLHGLVGFLEGMACLLQPMAGPIYVCPAWGLLHSSPQCVAHLHICCSVVRLWVLWMPLACLHIKSCIFRGCFASATMLPLTRGVQAKYREPSISIAIISLLLMQAWPRVALDWLGMADLCLLHAWNGMSQQTLSSFCLHKAVLWLRLPLCKYRRMSHDTWRSLNTEAQKLVIQLCLDACLPNLQRNVGMHPHASWLICATLVMQLGTRPTLL